MMKSFDFSEEFIKQGARLVRYHNRMSYIATHEDIYSEKTILNFTGLITSKDTLKMLYVSYILRYFSRWQKYFLIVQLLHY